MSLSPTSTPDPSPHLPPARSPEALEPTRISSPRSSARFSEPASSTPVPDIASQLQFEFPPIYSFPPFYTLQPTLSTRNSQLASWSSLLLSHASNTHAFVTSPSSTIFTNTSLRRVLQPSDALEVLKYLVSQSTASWINSLSSISKKGKSTGGDVGDSEVYLWWKTPEEWARAIGKWVEETGQKGTVLTFYELLEGEELGRRGRDFLGLPIDMARHALKSWEKRGWCIMIGDSGVKFV